MVASNVRILSIDGGGVRGYLPALVMAELEQRAGVPAASLFDLIVGTSTGGIIGIGLAAGLTAQTLADFYPTYGRRIFGGAERSTASRLVLGNGATFAESMGRVGKFGAIFGRPRAQGGGARHNASGLTGVLTEILGTTRLSEVQVELSLTSFDGLRSQPVVMSSRDARSDPAFDLPLVDVARATSAAPTYFLPHEISWGGSVRQLVDGGVWANNPAAVALTESMHLTSERRLTAESVVLVSIGTGRANDGLAFAGTDSWIGSGRDLVKSATSVMAGEVLAARAVPAGQYFRLQVVDDRIAGAMDDPSTARLSALRAAAGGLLKERTHDLDRIVSLLR